MKKYILLCLLFGWATASYAQTIIIKDQETNKPLELVMVVGMDSKVFVITNTEGKADISALKEQSEIEIRTLGYKLTYLSYAEMKAANFEIKLIPSNLNLNEVVVSATRWRQNSENVPSKIISISAKAIALQNPQTAADLLGISGKIFIQKSQQGGGSPMIRGLATNRLLYTVDGIRMNTAIFRAGNIQNVINIDPFAVENTEVLFGAGSVIYGSDAIGGVMSFQTLTPQLSLDEEAFVTGKAITRYASANNEKTGHFDINVGWKKWALVTSFSSWDFDNLQQGSNGSDDYIKDYYVERQNGVDVIVTQDNPLLQIPSAYSQVNLMQKIRFKPNEYWDFQYGFHYSETSPYGRYDRHNRTRNDVARYAEWNYGAQKWMMNNLTVTHDKKNIFYDQMSIRLAQQRFEESRIDRSLNSDERNTQTENVLSYSGNLDFKKTFARPHTLFYGVEYVINDVSSTGILTDIITGMDSKGASRYPNSTWGSIAVYLNEEYKINKKFTLQTGFRYNQYTLNSDFTNNLDFYPFSFSSAKINNNSLTGSIGGVYHPSNNWVVSANFGTAFRAPNVDDIGKIFDSEPGAVTVPNPNLEAEYAYNFDLNVAKVWNDVVKIEVTGYYTILQNALVRRNFQLNGQDSIFYDDQLSQVQAIQNAAVANVYGIQASLNLKLATGLNLSSDINYQVGYEELDDATVSASRHAAPLFGVTRLDYKTKNLNLQFYANYQAERKFENLAIEEQGKSEIYAKDVNGNNYAPAWYTLNIKALINITENIAISTGVENLTDQRYRPYSSGISASGRNFILSVRANF
jgi:hemoglobin/transferrin/lactoferrin receptor protein